MNIKANLLAGIIIQNLNIFPNSIHDRFYPMFKQVDILVGISKNGLTDRSHSLLKSTVLKLIQMIGKGLLEVFPNFWK